MKKFFVMLFALVALIGATRAAAMPADAGGVHVTKAPLMCACGGGGLPYCDTYEVGVQLYATWYWFPNAMPQYPVWRTGNWTCSYGTAATTERNLSIQAGLDPDSGPGKAWEPS